MSIKKCVPRSALIRQPADRWDGTSEEEGYRFPIKSVTVLCGAGTEAQHRFRQVCVQYGRFSIYFFNLQHSSITFPEQCFSSLGLWCGAYWASKFSKLSLFSVWLIEIGVDVCTGMWHYCFYKEPLLISSTCGINLLCLLLGRNKQKGQVALAKLCTIT